MKSRWVSCVVVGVLLGSPLTLRAQPAPATVREYKKIYRTYPYSDPNPIPAMGRIYPYFRFDRYTDRAVDREWTVVEIENEFIKVVVLPQIGGKIWTAVEKSTGRPFIYNNQVVKFRDIAMRGPWTSGGIEPNYGILGHTPNCATPVDYLTRTNPDGSASVIIGALDLLTRTPWRLEITVPADKAYFTTRSFWYNATPLEQPYYTWMNAGIKAAGNLELVYPGTHYLGHNGEFAAWPLHETNGHNLSFYEQNAFGRSKSYHVFGQYADFFGAYWHDDDFGMGRYATHDDKAGKKIWIWGLSRQGMIWEQLLTDGDGQYVEVQSGRLFNQSAPQSTLTPFKHRGFAPYQADGWTEYWFPIKGTKGLVKANDVGALNVQSHDGRLILAFCPLQPVNATLEVFDGDRLAYSKPLSLRPMETWTESVPASVGADRLRVRIEGSRFDYQADPKTSVLSRPLASPAGFDWESVQGLYLKGLELARQRMYAEAQASLEACLRADPNYLPALDELAMLRYRAMDYHGAWDRARRALSIDTYDPAANYCYGLASVRLGKMADAKDGFDVASLSPEFRSAAWTELSKISLGQADLARAIHYATRSLDFNRFNLDGYQVLALAHRLRNERAETATAVQAILALDPLNHFARFETYLLSGATSDRQAFVLGIRNEMPHQTFLELALWYHDLGRLPEAAQVLELAPQRPEVLYWRAALEHRQGRDFRPVLAKADAASPHLVFPFRSETAEVLEWARSQSEDWRPRYYLALIFWSRNETTRARALFEECGAAPDFPPFYAVRAAFLRTLSPEGSLADLLRAAALDRGEWRYGKLLTERYIDDKAYDKALETAEQYYQAAPENYMLGMLCARTLLLNGRYGEAGDLLRRLHVLPYEGSTDGRSLYREVQLMLALAQFAAGHAESALRLVGSAREWPENLGAGKPYRADVDERLEDWLELTCLETLNRSQQARTALDRIRTSGGSTGGAGALVAALAAKKLGQQTEAVKLLRQWAVAQSSPTLAAWGERIFGGETLSLPEGVVTDEEYRVLAAWLAGGPPPNGRAPEPGFSSRAASEGSPHLTEQLARRTGPGAPPPEPG